MQRGAQSERKYYKHPLDILEHPARLATLLADR